MNRILIIVKSISEVSRENEITDCTGDVLQLQTAITEINHTVFLNVIEAKESAVFNEAEFAKSILNLVTDNESEEVVWSKLDEYWPSIFNTVYHAPSLYGTYDLVEKEKPSEEPKPKQAIKRATQSANLVPEEIQKFEVDDDKSLRIFYTKIIKCYKQNSSNPIPFYKLICDPNSFPESVNNAFLCSFLINNNLLKIFKQDEVTMVEPFDSDSPFTAKKGGDNQIHAVMSLDYNLWQTIIANFNVNTSMTSDAGHLDDDSQNSSQSLALF